MLKGNFAEWSTAEKNNLPDSSFAYIEAGGTKDSDGKTTPRSLRHLPYKDADGKADLPHVRNALARLSKTQIPDSAKTGIKGKLEKLLEGTKHSEAAIRRMPVLMPVEVHFSEDGSPTNHVHLIPTGKWNHPAYGQMEITPDDIREFSANFRRGLRKGVPITEGHEVSDEKPAVGWIKDVFDEGAKGLFGDVDWTPGGKQLLSEKKYKYFSPEFYREYEDPETRETHSNVLTGGALTNKPYFKELSAVVLSEANLINKDNNMNLQEIVAKNIADLSAEEKDFIRANKSSFDEEGLETYKQIFAEKPAKKDKGEDDDGADDGDDMGKDEEYSDKPDNWKDMSADDQKTWKKKNKSKRKMSEDGADAGDGAAEKTPEQIEAENIAKGLNADGTEKKVEASEKVMINASELAVLREKADKGHSAFAELRTMKLTTQATSLIFSESNKKAPFLAKSKEVIVAFMETLSESQLGKFKELMSQIPEKMSSNLFSEAGAGDSAAGDAQKIVDNKVEEMLKANPKMKYSDALKKVFSENAGLHAEYVSSLGGKQINA